MQERVGAPGRHSGPTDPSPSSPALLHRPGTSQALRCPPSSGHSRPALVTSRSPQLPRRGGPHARFRRLDIATRPGAVGRPVDLRSRTTSARNSQNDTIGGRSLPFGAGPRWCIGGQLRHVGSHRRAGDDHQPLRDRLAGGTGGRSVHRGGGQPVPALVGGEVSRGVRSLHLQLRARVRSLWVRRSSPIVRRRAELAAIAAAFGAPVRRRRWSPAPRRAGVGKTTLARSVASLSHHGASVGGTDQARAIPLGIFAHLLSSPTATTQSPCSPVPRPGIRSSPEVLTGRDRRCPYRRPSVGRRWWINWRWRAGWHRRHHRTGEPIPDTITALWKDGYLVRLDVTPFTKAEAVGLIEAALERPPRGAVRRPDVAGLAGQRPVRAALR